MVRVSGVRVRRGGNRRVRKNGQTTNQFVQVTQLLEFEEGVYPNDTDKATAN